MLPMLVCDSVEQNFTDLVSYEASQMEVQIG